MSDTIKIWDDDGPDGKTTCLEIDQGGNHDLYLRIVGTDAASQRGPFAHTVTNGRIDIDDLRAGDTLVIGTQSIEFTAKGSGL